MLHERQGKEKRVSEVKERHPLFLQDLDQRDYKLII
jgi:hypothetical protein